MAVIPQQGCIALDEGTREKTEMGLAERLVTVSSQGPKTCEDPRRSSC